MNWSWFLSDPVSTFGERIDSIYYVILWITGAVFVLTEGLLLWCVVRYRRRDGRRAHYSHGNAKLEVAWTVIPFVIVLGIAWVSTQAWLEAKVPDRTAVAEDDLTLRVMAKQFEWNVTYPGPDGELDTPDDFVKRNQLHVPVGRAIRVELLAEDVIHSFFLPDLRVKQDAVPGMMIPVWFQATEAGEYPLACAELCGIGHYSMDATLTVHEVGGFEEWMSTEMGETTLEPETVPAPADTAAVELDGEPANEPADEGEERA